MPIRAGAAHWELFSPRRDPLWDLRSDRDSGAAAGPGDEMVIAGLPSLAPLPSAYRPALAANRVLARQRDRVGIGHQRRHAANRHPAKGGVGWEDLTVAHRHEATEFAAGSRSTINGAPGCGTAGNGR